MFKYTCTYTNYFGEERTETACFQLSRPEVFEFAAGLPGGITAGAQKLIESHDESVMFDKFQKIIAKAYGEISPDGRRFMKSPELSKSFMETPIYEQLFDKMLTDANFTREFLMNCVPGDSKEDVGTALADFLRSNDDSQKEPTVENEG